MTKKFKLRTRWQIVESMRESFLDMCRQVDGWEDRQMALHAIEENYADLLERTAADLKAAEAIENKNINPVIN